MTRILHVWDLSGVACTLAKFQKKLGHTADVIKRSGFDKFGIMEFYNQETVKSWYGNQFLKTAAKRAENYDVIHVHDLIKLIPMIKKKFPEKKVVLQYHGSILRNTPAEKRNESESIADAVLISTPDLKNYVNGIYLPNPVDIEHFSKKNVPKNNKALSLMTKNETEEALSEVIKSHGFSMDFEAIPREKEPIKYSQMPDFLANYEYVVDVKYINGKIVSAYSMVGLQALSVGLKVINHNLEIVEGLPAEHDPLNVTENVLKIYNNII